MTKPDRIKAQRMRELVKRAGGTDAVARMLKKTKAEIWNALPCDDREKMEKKS